MGKTLKFGVLRVSNVVNDVDNHIGTTFDCFLSWFTCYENGWIGVFMELMTMVCKVSVKRWGFDDYHYIVVVCGENCWDWSFLNKILELHRCVNDEWSLAHELVHTWCLMKCQVE